MAMHRPPGTKFLMSSGLGPARPFNGIAEKFLREPELEWLFLTNDDNLCPADTIPRLLMHDVDVVTGLYFARMQPFEPIIFDSIDIKDGRRWYNKHLMKPGDKGLIPVVACGDGCLLIRRHVLQIIPDPWWEYGETLTDTCDHDIVFSRKVLEHKFGLFCDLELRVDHLSIMAIRPHRNPDGTWHTHLVQGSGEPRALSVPAASVIPMKK